MINASKKSTVSETRRSNPIFSSAENSRALASTAEMWFSVMTECQREMIGFVSMRLAKDGDTFRQIVSCKSAAEAATLQAHWMEDTRRDYDAEMTKLLTICARSSREKL
ncbi:phasin family protein [Microvirga puerhi]|uniref:Phasin family protein n=1 Tax=Microvirga puerhi TaxID=2876078 RepID=A0ABS7VLN5_9HYPH|nr:phasin family protein [Microvirga puerhi]MBZ6075912.1 phasin family protein [Microvirga puerhi]